MTSLKEPICSQMNLFGPASCLDPESQRKDDLGLITNAALWMLLGISAVFLSLRLYSKLLRHRRLQLDDGFLIAAWCALVTASIATSIGISHGLGKHQLEISQEDFDKLPILGLLAVSFQVIGQAWSKTSFGITMMRISEKRMRRFILFGIISINVLLALSAISNWVGCTPIQKAWHPQMPGKCWNPRIGVTYTIVAAAYSGIWDLILAVLPWKIIMGLQMKFKEKLGVALAMSMGVFAATFAFLKCSTVPLLTAPDFSHNGVPLIVWGVAEGAVTIMAASLPMLRILLVTVKAKVSRGRSQEAPWGLTEEGSYAPRERRAVRFVRADEKNEFELDTHDVVGMRPTSPAAHV